MSANDKLWVPWWLPVACCPWSDSGPAVGRRAAGPRYHPVEQVCGAPSQGTTVSSFVRCRLSPDTKHTYEERLRWILSNAEQLCRKVRDCVLRHCGRPPSDSSGSRINEYRDTGAASKTLFHYLFQTNKTILVLPVDHSARRSMKIASKCDS